jgi:hypothetical protein
MELNELLGEATFTAEGKSPDTPLKLRGAELSRHLKKQLRASFPGVAFKVHGSRGTAWGWFSVDWTDGPRYDEVKAVTNSYCYARFDGMTDGYESTGNGAWFDGESWIEPGARGINCQRTISEALAQATVAKLAAKWGHPAPTGSFERGEWWKQKPSESWTQNWQELVYRELSKEPEPTTEESVS